MENGKETNIKSDETNWTISLKESHNHFRNNNTVNFWRNEVFLNSDPNTYKEVEDKLTKGHRANVNFSLELFRINKLVLFKKEYSNKEKEDKEGIFLEKIVRDFSFIISGIMEKDYNDKTKIGDCKIMIGHNVGSYDNLLFNTKMMFNKIALGSEIPLSGFYLHLLDLKHKIDSALLKVYKSGDPLNVSIDLINLKTRGRVKSIEKAKEIIESSIVMDPSNEYLFYRGKLTHSLVISFSSLSIPYLKSELICYLGRMK